MLKFMMFVLCLLFIPSDGSARAVKLGAKNNRQATMNFSSQTSALNDAGISCLENKECSYDQECIALQCVNVCKNASCSEGTYCAPAGQDKPHEYQCAECVVNFHCASGMFCDRDYKCKLPDPCSDAVCSPAAPFCLPKPYKTLPYTCVQCTQDDHCPPVAGLTRRCIDGYCLFNVDGNIPQSSFENRTVTESVSSTEPEEDSAYEDDNYPYEDEYDDYY